MTKTPSIPEPPPAGRPGGRWQPGFKLRRVNEITGVFVLIVVAVLIAAVVWTGRSQRWFKGNVTLRIVLPETGAAGIREGSEVYFLGTLVGSVSDVLVDTSGSMEAWTSIRRDFFLFVRSDSSAVVKKKFGVAGDSFFEIIRGEGTPLPEDDAVIVCKEQFQSALELAVEQVRAEAMIVMKKVNEGLDTWTQLGADLRGTGEHLDQFSSQLASLTSDIKAGRGTVGTWIVDPALADAAQKLVAQANETMTELRGAVTNLNVAVKNVENGTARLPEITDAVANESKDLPGLVSQAQSSMREFERLVEAMQRHWLLRKYVNPTDPPSLDPPSEVVEPKPRPFKVLRSPRDAANQRRGR